VLTVIVAIAALIAGAAAGTAFGMVLNRHEVTELTAQRDALTRQIRQRDLALKSLTEGGDQ
jgi:outer membrane lipoprotein SlyB